MGSDLPQDQGGLTRRARPTHVQEVDDVDLSVVVAVAATEEELRHAQAEAEHRAREASIASVVAQRAGRDAQAAAAARAAVSDQGAAASDADLRSAETNLAAAREAELVARSDLEDAQRRLADVRAAHDDAVGRLTGLRNRLVHSYSANAAVGLDEGELRLPRRVATNRLRDALGSVPGVDPIAAELASRAAVRPEQARRSLAGGLIEIPTAAGTLLALEMELFTALVWPLLSNPRLADVAPGAGTQPTPLGSVALRSGAGIDNVVPLHAPNRDRLGHNLAAAETALADTGALAASIAEVGVLVPLLVVPARVWLGHGETAIDTLAGGDGDRRLATCHARAGLAPADLLRFAEDDGAWRSWAGKNVRGFPDLLAGRRGGITARAHVVVGFRIARPDAGLADAVFDVRTRTHMVAPPRAFSARSRGELIVNALDRCGLLTGLPAFAPPTIAHPGTDEEGIDTPVPSSEREGLLTPDVFAVYALTRLLGDRSVNPTAAQAWTAASQLVGRPLQRDGGDGALAAAALMLRPVDESAWVTEPGRVHRAMTGLTELARQVQRITALFAVDRMLDEPLGDVHALAARAEDEIAGVGEPGPATVALLVRGGFFLGVHGVLADLSSERDTSFDALATSQIGLRVLVESVRMGLSGMAPPFLDEHGNYDLVPVNRTDDDERAAWLYRSMTSEQLGFVLSRAVDAVEAAPPEGGRERLIAAQTKVRLLIDQLVGAMNAVRYITDSSGKPLIASVGWSHLDSRALRAHLGDVRDQLAAYGYRHAGEDTWDFPTERGT